MRILFNCLLVVLHGLPSGFASDNGTGESGKHNAFSKSIIFCGLKEHANNVPRIFRLASVVFTALSFFKIIFLLMSLESFSRFLRMGS